MPADTEIFLRKSAHYNESDDRDRIIHGVSVKVDGLRIDSDFTYRDAAEGSPDKPIIIGAVLE